jgi:hypothetical protein
MQTLDMTLVKKRRLTVNRSSGKSSSGFWSMLTRSNGKGCRNNPKSEFNGSICKSVPCFIVTGNDFSNLREEIASLEELSRHLFLEIVELRNMQERAEWSKTWKGIYFNFLGYFFSMYCMWKIFIVSS